MATVPGLPLPGRTPTHRNADINLLPYDKSKSYVYRKYRETSEDLDEYYFCSRKFESPWQEL